MAEYGSSYHAYTVLVGCKEKKPHGYHRWEGEFGPLACEGYSETESDEE